MRTREEEFYESARSHSRRRARASGLTPDQAAECEQEFVLHWFLEPGHPPYWTLPRRQQEAFLRRAARNHLINFVRDIRTEANRIRPILSESDFDADILELAASQGIDDQLCRDLFWDKLYGGLLALTEEQKRLFACYHLKCATVSEIAAFFGCSADVISHRLARVHQRLRSALTTKGDTEQILRSCLPQRSTPSASSVRANAKDGA